MKLIDKIINNLNVLKLIELLVCCTAIKIKPDHASIRDKNLPDGGNAQVIKSAG